MKKIYIIMVSLLLSSCDADPIFLIVGLRPNPSSLYGTYTEDYKYAKEKLVLNEDGTYFQEIITKNNQHKVMIAGKWRIEQIKGFRKYYDVIFERPLMDTINWMGDFDSAYERKQALPGNLIALKKFRTIYIGDCSKPNKCYKKISNAQMFIKIGEKPIKNEGGPNNIAQ